MSSLDPLVDLFRADGRVAIGHSISDFSQNLTVP
jgi:hypothetical protein